MNAPSKSAASTTVPAKNASAAGRTAPARVRQVMTPSGIEIWHVEDYTVPVVSVEFAFLGGASQDPDGRVGLGNLLAGVMDEGAGALDSQGFQEALEEQAIELSFDAGRDRLDGSLRTLAENAPRAFELLGLAVQAPRFDADAIDRVRAQIISGLKRDESDPSARVRDALGRLAYPDHRYGLPVDGRIPDLGEVTRDDIVRQHQRLCARDALRIVAVGAISPEALAREVESAFGPLPARAELAALGPARMANLGRTEIVDLDIPQSTLYLALPGIARKDPAFMPASVLNHILGGGSFTSRLWMEIREKRGLAYSVWSMLSPRKYGAMFLAGTATSNERVGESLVLMREEIARIGEAGASADELDRARRFLVGSYALRFDTSRKIANQLLENMVEDLGIDYIDRRNDEIAAVTLEAMREAAAQLFADAQPLIVAAGRPLGL